MEFVYLCHLEMAPDAITTIKPEISSMMNNRPHIICLMMTSIDGKILGEKWGDSTEVRAIVKCFEETHDAIGNKSWIVGRTTMEKDFTHFAKPVFRKSDRPMNREDFVAQPNAGSYAVVIDGYGKLG